jgi:hypothetical protein
MSYDAVMRWEWEGGAPASVSERDEATRAEPAEDTLTRQQPTNRVLRTRRVATGAVDDDKPLESAELGAS